MKSTARKKKPATVLVRFPLFGNNDDVPLEQAKAVDIEAEEVESMQVEGARDRMEII
jgi:hypothetical protein